LSISEIALNVIFRRVITYDADWAIVPAIGDSASWFFSIVHVWGGHIPMPLIPHFLRKWGKFKWIGTDCRRL
jgi:hypothetical protein